jgi:hypothetical protein
VHTYTLRDEAQFVLPTCGDDIICEFGFLFKSLGMMVPLLTILVPWCSG